MYQFFLLFNKYTVRLIDVVICFFGIRLVAFLSFYEIVLKNKVNL